MTNVILKSNLILNKYEGFKDEGIVGYFVKAGGKNNFDSRNYYNPFVSLILVYKK